MTAFNVVRFRVKPGREQEFIDLHRNMGAEGLKGARRFVLVKTGDRSFCEMGEWDSFDNIVNARATMIGFLDGMRDCLEDLGSGLGVTDPVSGEAVFEMGPPAKAAKGRRAGSTRRKAASKGRVTSARRAKAAPKKKAGAKAAKRKPAKKPARKAAAKRGRRG